MEVRSGQLRLLQNLLELWVSAKLSRTPNGIRTRVATLKGRRALTASDYDVLDQGHFPLNQMEGHLFRGTTVAVQREMLRDSFAT